MIPQDIRETINDACIDYQRQFNWMQSELGHPQTVLKAHIYWLESIGQEILKLVEELKQEVK